MNQEKFNKNNNDIKIFSLNSNKVLAEKISTEIGIPLSKCNVKKFSDGEIFIDIEESVRNDIVFIIQSTSSPVNDNLMELLIMIDALRRASAKEINVVIPYYGYARQDRKAKSRQPITAKLVANLIEKAGANRVIALDLHASQIQGFFDIPVDHVWAYPIFVNQFKEELDLSNTIVVSPDHGGVKRARVLAKKLDVPLAIIDKRRPLPNQVAVENIIGDVEGKNAIMLDDLVDTAGTLCAAADLLIEKGAKKVIAASTHGVLSGEAITKIENSKLEKLLITDTIELPKEKQIPKIEVYTTAPLLSKLIAAAYEGKSLTDISEVAR